MGVLDLENDKRDWMNQFSVEFESERREHSLRRKSDSLFTVVQHARPLPIVLPPPSATSETLPLPGHHHRSLSRRIKRAVSPTLTALFLAYLAVVFMTAWIGVRRSEAVKNGDSTIHLSAPASGLEPANRP